MSSMNTTFLQPGNLQASGQRPVFFPQPLLIDNADNPRGNCALFGQNDPIRQYRLHLLGVCFGLGAHYPHSTREKRRRQTDCRCEG